MSLLREIHVYGPVFLREARKQHGYQIDVMLRRKELIRVRIPGGDVLLLGPKGKEQLTGNRSYKYSAFAEHLQQLMTRGQVIKHLEGQGYTWEKHRGPFLTEMRDAHGNRTIIAVNKSGYHERSLFRLVSSTLLGDLLGDAHLLVYTPNPEKLAGAAQDYANLFELKNLNVIQARTS